MRKITLLMIAVATGLVAFASNPEIRTSNSGKYYTATPSGQLVRSAKKAPPANHSTQVPFYSEDFAGGIPAGWTLVDSASSGVNWTVST
ncbi:MAG: hypothetical protein ACKOQ6_07300, partial [Bacteroidota bacterium]